jgi:hypothetical protein
MTLANERRAERAARVRGLRDARRDPKPRRTTADVDAVRAGNCVPTLVELRNGLPSYTYARKQATHSDAIYPMRAFVQSAEQPNVFGCALRTAATPPPKAGDVLHLAARVGNTTQTFCVVECYALTSRMYSVVLRVLHQSLMTTQM